MKKILQSLILISLTTSYISAELPSWFKDTFYLGSIGCLAYGFWTVQQENQVLKAEVNEIKKREHTQGGTLSDFIKDQKEKNTQISTALSEQKSLFDAFKTSVDQQFKSITDTYLTIKTFTDFQSAFSEHKKAQEDSLAALRERLVVNEKLRITHYQEHQNAIKELNQALETTKNEHKAQIDGFKSEVTNTLKQTTESLNEKIGRLNKRIAVTNQAVKYFWGNYRITHSNKDIHTITNSKLEEKFRAIAGKTADDLISQLD